MAKDLMIGIGAEFTGKPAFRQADTAIGKLNVSVKTLAKSFGLAYGARGLALYAKNSVKAFAADDKAARSLSKTLGNLGLAYADPKIKTFISTLESQYGVLDDLLRPAYQSLVVATGDWVKAQDLLVTALNVSAGTGKDLQSVTTALSKAYLGNTTALSRLGAGLSKAELASGDFAAIVERLNVVFAGQAQQAADSYSGALDRLTVAGENAKEVIGKGLVDAFAAFGGSGGLTQTITNIENLSTTIANLTVGLSRTLAYVKALLGYSGGESLNPFADANALMKKWNIQDASPISSSKYQKETWGLVKKQVVLQKQQNKLTKEANALQKAAIKDKKLAAVFDLDQIQVMAALQGKITEEEKLRLQLQLAMMQGQTEEAQRLAEKLAQVQGQTGMLSLYLKTLPDAKNPFASWSDYLKAIEDQLKRIATVQPSVAASSAATTTAIAAATSSAIGSTAWIEAQKVLAANKYYGVSGTYTGYEIPTNVSMAATEDNVYSAGYTSQPSVVVNVAGSVTTEQDLTNTILQNLYGVQSRGGDVVYQARAI